MISAIDKGYTHPFSCEFFCRAETAETSSDDHDLWQRFLSCEYLHNGNSKICFPRKPTNCDGPPLWIKRDILNYSNER